MVLVELFLTVFTVNRTNCTDIIMDAVLLADCSVFLKVMIVFFKTFEEEILQLRDFCKLGTHLSLDSAIYERPVQGRFHGSTEFKESDRRSIYKQNVCR